MTPVSVGAAVAGLTSDLILLLFRGACVLSVGVDCSLEVNEETWNYMDWDALRQASGEIG